MAEKAILYDATKCTACRGCQAACKQWNENDEGAGEKTVMTGSYENPPDLSPKTWLKMEFREVENGGKVDWLFNRRSCMHCTEAACVKVCPNGTLAYDGQGAVSLNKDTCTGCGYCVDFCPFQVPRSTRNLLTGVAKADKCTLCTTPGFNRLAEGMQPACVKSCPPHALDFGDRAAMLDKAKARVLALKAKGNPNANLYGEKELGGLHVLYVLKNAPDTYGLPRNPIFPATATAWQSVIQPLGWAVGGLTLVGLGLNFLVAREAKMSKELPGKKKGGK